MDIISFTHDAEVVYQKIPEETITSRGKLIRAEIASHQKRDEGRSGRPGYLLLSEDKILEDYLLFQSTHGLAYTYGQIRSLVCYNFFFLLIIPYFLRHAFSDLDEHYRPRN
jgi:hypothetical protein